MEQLQIIYKGNMIKVTPLPTDKCTQFVVHMATGDVKIEMVVKDDRSRFWQETETGETQLANELGDLIEQVEHN